MTRNYGASRVDAIRRCNYELSRVMGMRMWLTVMNATIAGHNEYSSPIPERVELEIGRSAARYAGRQRSASPEYFLRVEDQPVGRLRAVQADHR